MSDVFTPMQRSQVMSRIRDRDTKPELMVRSMLHQLGYRFTVNGPSNKQLPGRPDIVLPRHDTVIFVHGCFWHAHEHCEYFRLPKTRPTWWRKKLEGNRARDERQQAKLVSMGWNVTTIWECCLKKESDRNWLLDRLPKLIG